MSEAIVAIDIGGTHARFALAEVAGGAVVSFGEATTFATCDHEGFNAAWDAFAQRHGGTLPRAAAIAVAGSPRGDIIRFTNNPWTIRPALLAEQFGIDRQILINDFDAVGHAVAQADAAGFVHLCGPDVPLPATGTICIVGPGTGLGIAHVWRDGGDYRVQPTEGGHNDFAPVDGFDDALLARLRRRFGRVSIERVVAGPAIVDIYETLAGIEGIAGPAPGERAIWTAAIDGSDDLATAAIDRFCLALGSIAGDLALVQGASGVVIAGGLGLRLEDRLVRSGFADRFIAKGRYTEFMATLPVKLIARPEPGLFGVAAAFARRFR